MSKQGFDFETWMKWRSQMIFVYFNASFFLGLTYGIYFGTEFLYIKDILHAPRPALWYGIGTGAQYAISILGAVFGSIYYDFRRDIVNMAYFYLMCVLLGNVFYATSMSVWFVVVGNLLFGSTSLGIVGYMAEFTHIFDESMLTKQMAYNSMFFTVAKLLGPCLAYGFVEIDRTWKGWRISYGNMPAILMGSYAALCFLINFLFVKNLAKIYDLKADKEFARLNLLKSKQQDNAGENTKESEDDILEGSGLDQYKRLIESEQTKYEFTSVKQYLTTFVAITMERHFFILLFVAMVMATCNLLVYQLIIVKAATVLHWSPNRISNLRIVSTVLGILSAVVVSKLSKVFMDYYFFITAACTGIVLAFLMALLPFMEGSEASMTAFLYVNSTVFGISETISTIASVTMVAKLVRSEFQGLAESVRYCVTFLGSALASFYLDFANSHMTVTCLCAAVLNTCCVVLLTFEYPFYVRRWSLA